MALAAHLRGKAVLLGAAVLVGQLSVGWSNDAIDAPLDTAAARRDKPITLGMVSRRLVAGAAVTSLAADVPLSLAVGVRPGLLHLLAVALAWAYNVGVKRTAASPLPYAAAFGLVPVVVAAAKPGSPAPRAALVVAGVACGIAAHFANTVGDTVEDELTGVRGLPQRFGPSASTIVAGGFVAAADVVLAACIPWLLHGTPSRRRAFRLVIAAVGVLVVAFVVAGGSRLT